MMELVVYTLVAISVVTLVVVLLRQTRRRVPGETEPDQEGVQNLTHEPWLKLAERLLDPADCHWLREQLSYPGLADSLARARQAMALRWLRAVRHSFQEMIRVPVPHGGPGGGTAGSPESWRLLWLTLRFHLLLSYAILVVRVFGPYHRLIPSLDWAISFLRPNAQTPKPTTDVGSAL